MDTGSKTGNRHRKFSNINRAQFRDEYDWDNNDNDDEKDESTRSTMDTHFRSSSIVDASDFNLVLAMDNIHTFAAIMRYKKKL